VIRRGRLCIYILWEAAARPAFIPVLPLFWGIYPAFFVMKLNRG